MKNISKLLLSAKREIFSKWLVFVQMAVSISISCVIVVSFFSSIPEIQSIDYGVLKFAGVLFLVVWLIYMIFDKYQTIHPVGHPAGSVGKVRKLSLTAVLIIPVAVSWIANGSFYGAINPLGFWNDELLRNSPSKCLVFEQVLAGGADELRVTQNKFRKGLATARELEISVQVFQAFTESHGLCLRSAASRLQEAEKRLSGLRQRQ
jgi:hypothetical protein